MRRGIFFLLSAFMAVCCSTGPARAGEEWREIRDGSLTVRFQEPLGEEAEEVAALYPSLTSGLEERLGLPADFPHMVVLVKDREEFRQMAGSALVVAAAFPGQYLVVVDYARVVEEPFTLASTLRHELCHLMLHHYIEGPARTMGGYAFLPRWLDEGVCQWASGGPGELESLGKSTEIAGAALFGRLLPLSSLERGFPGDDRRLVLAYEESRSMVEFIAGRYGKGGLRAVLGRLRAGEPLEAAIERGLGTGYRELEAAWHAELKSGHTWLTWLSNNLYGLIFALCGLVLLAGFIRVMWRLRTYRDEEETTHGSHE